VGFSTTIRQMASDSVSDILNINNEHNKLHIRKRVVDMVLLTFVHEHRVGAREASQKFKQASPMQTFTLECVCMFLFLIIQHRLRLF